MSRPITSLFKNVSGVSICFLLYGTSMPVPGDGFVKKPKHTARCGQYRYQGWRTYRTRKISLARGIHCCPNLFIYFARTGSLYCEEYVYIYVYMYVCVRACVRACGRTYLTAYTPYMNYRCYQISLRVKHFYTNCERGKVLTGYLSIGRRTGGDRENTWHSGLQSYFPIGSSSIPSYLRVFFLIASSRTLLETE
jgi:hypothetical protein